MTTFHPSIRLGARGFAASLCTALLLPVLAHASPIISVPEGTRFLRAQLPADTDLDKVDCRTLSRALKRAVRGHRDNGTEIFVAALTGGRTGHVKVLRPCACVRELFHAAAAAAPERAVAITEQTVMYCEQCADELTKEIAAMNDKNVVADADDDGDGRPASTRATRQESADELAAALGVADAATANAADGTTTGAPGTDPNSIHSPDGANANGFGVGFGPGFPGSPGFTGSLPSGGGIILPPNPVTSVVNQ